MNRVFLQTQNVHHFVTAMNALTGAHPEAPKMGVVTGVNGRGKTRTAIWYAASREALYMRAKFHWRGNYRYVLRELAFETGNKPVHRSDALYRQVVNALKQEPRAILIDEADYLDAGAVHTIRDVHDEAGVPVVLIGVSQITATVLREQAVWSRVVQNVQFSDLTRAEIPDLINQLCEVPVSEELAENVAENTSNMRDLVRYVLQIEHAWKDRKHAAPLSVAKGFKVRVLKGRAIA